MNPYADTIRQLAEYEVWCNGRSLESAAALDPDDLFRRFSFGLGTIHRTLFHTLNVLEHWTGFVSPARVDAEWREYNPASTIDDLRRLNGELATAFIAAVDRSDAAGLLGRDRRLVQVFHLVTHGTHHRTQFITMLRFLGKEPPFEAGDFAGWQRDRPT